MFSLTLRHLFRQTGHLSFWIFPFTAIQLQLGAQMRSLQVEAAKCCAGFSRHSAPPAASRFTLRAELLMLKAGLRGVARSFRNTLSFGSSEGWPETWTFFRAACCLPRCLGIGVPPAASSFDVVAELRPFGVVGAYFR